jgi:hypothetical protein
MMWYCQLVLVEWPLALLLVLMLLMLPALLPGLDSAQC